MAYVDRAAPADLDHLLDRAFAAWEGLAEVECEIESWDPEDQIAFVEEWPLEDERLQRLAKYAGEGLLSERQYVRYQLLLKLVERSRPIAERLTRT